jgi:exopolysaccharide biosynthesis protein
MGQSILTNGYPMHLRELQKQLFTTVALTVSLLMPPLNVMATEAVAIGVVAPMPTAAVRRVPSGRVKRAVKSVRKVTPAARRKASRAVGGKKRVQDKKKKVAPQKVLRPPQDELGVMSTATLAPGVVHKTHRGALNINILDVDLANPNIEVKPVMASESFNRLDEVKDQAQKVKAIAAVNANYFKKDGTPLGTLVVDGEWISGPLYDRISMGITDSGKVLVDRMNLHGTIETSNPEVPNIWVNNINQPRRHGTKLVAYTRRWGSHVKMAYAGTLVAVDASGRVIDKSTQVMAIPYGGFVLSDTKSGDIRKLNRGDLVYLQWHTRPQSWADVKQAVSGGPTLIRNGKLFLDLKDQNFRKTWTSSSIHARTALGVTANRHLILLTVEGPHTLWDVAKVLKRLGCVEAMNLDGGGSTTMVLNGKIVTRNAKTPQRRVAASLAIVPRSTAAIASRQANFVPSSDLSEMFEPATADKVELSTGEQIADPVANEITEKIIAELEKPEEPTGLSCDVIEPTAAQEPQIIHPKKKKKEKKLKHLNWMKRFIPGQPTE